MHLIASAVGMLGAALIVAGTISLALGAALAASVRKDASVAVSFFGDGAAGEGVLYESMNFAALKSLPLIFVCENNLYSTHMAIGDIRAGSPTIFEGAAIFQMKTSKVDGNNVLEVFEAAQEAVTACRNGRGPVFLECLTYRLRGHVGPDDNIQGSHTDIRPPDEVADWRARDPILAFEEFLLDNGVIDTDTMEEMKAAIGREVDEAHAFARQSPSPSSSEVARYVFR